MPDTDSPITAKVPWPKFMLTPAYAAMQKTLATFNYKLIVSPVSTAGQPPEVYIVNIVSAASRPPA